MSRKCLAPVEPILINRWSSRAMNGKPLEPGHLAQVLEGARWSPSGGNKQPWRFVYALQGSPAFPSLLAALDEGNRAWCVRAGALFVTCVSVVTSRGTPNRVAFFEAGLAWMGLSLQASAMGLVSHTMGGFDLDAARLAVGATPQVEVVVMGAVGYPGDPAQLAEKDRAREVPSDRNPPSQWAFEGKLPA